MSKYEELKRLAATYEPEEYMRVGACLVLELLAELERLEAEVTNERIERIRNADALKVWANGLADSAIRLTIEKAARSIPHYEMGVRAYLATKKSIRSLSVEDILKELGTSGESIATSSGKASEGGNSEQGVSLTEQEAKRYRFLRQQNAFMHRVKVAVWESPRWQVRSCEELDAAIDAAIAQEGKQG